MSSTHYLTVFWFKKQLTSLADGAAILSLKTDFSSDFSIFVSDSFLCLVPISVLGLYKKRCIVHSSLPPFPVWGPFVTALRN